MCLPQCLVTGSVCNAGSQIASDHYWWKVIRERVITVVMLQLRCALKDMILTTMHAAHCDWSENACLLACVRLTALVTGCVPDSTYAFTNEFLSIIAFIYPHAASSSMKWLLLPASKIEQPHLSLCVNIIFNNILGGYLFCFKMLLHFACNLILTEHNFIACTKYIALTNIGLVSVKSLSWLSLTTV